MTELEVIHTGRHRVFTIHAHLVFVTKLQHKVFTDRHTAHMGEIMPAACADFQTEPVELNSKNNHHIHPLVNSPPKIALTKLVNTHKRVPNRRIHQKFPDLARHYYQANRLWSGSYFTGSADGTPSRAVPNPGTPLPVGYRFSP